MTKRLDEAFAEARRLSESDQDALAEILMAYTASRRSNLHLLPRQRAEVMRRLSDPRDIVSDAEVLAFFKRLDE